ncbi:hypothetical protein V1264_024225 [Littorina saxatilis]|uniref:RING-type domain-containing protein n=2 Tax=Littorina saxatilis TaxID=31220 RepID=A0AAN9AN07_9CAEN
MTPLVYAALRGQRQCIVTLLEMGADVNRHASSDRRRTPVSAAIEGKDPSVLEVLLQQGADTRYLYTNGHTAVHHSVIKNKPVALTLLAMYGADMNATDALGDSPLHMAIERNEHEAMEVLVDTAQVDMYVCNQNGFNAIQLSSLVGNPTALAKLLSRDKSGVDLVRTESTALHMAATSDHVDCVRLLVIEGGAEVNKGDLRKGLTALHAACLGGCLQTAEALLELGAQVNVRNTDGDTPLHFVIGGKIENYGKSEKAEVELACRVQIANMLISNGAFVDAQNEAGKHPFMFGHTRVREGVRAFMNSNKNIVKWQNKELAKFTLGSTQHSSASSFSSSSSYSSSRGGKEEGPLREALKGVGLPCGVCGAPRSDVTLQPCQHKCVCSTCSVKVTVCPLCDEEVKDKVFTGQDGQTVDPEDCKQM